MARNNKPISVEINDLDANRSEVIVNKNSLGIIDEVNDTIQVIFGDQRKVTAKNFDEAVSLLIAEYNLHH